MCEPVLTPSLLAALTPASAFDPQLVVVCVVVDQIGNAFELVFVGVVVYHSLDSQQSTIQ